MTAYLIEKLINAGIEANEAKKEILILEQEIKDKEKIKKIIEERIKTRKPIQYLLGKAYFMDFYIKVNERVLIPRPETEILVEEAVKRIRGERCPSHLSALDIGTGSGIIPIALCKMIPNIQVTAIDIDKEVINLAYENAKAKGAEKRINFIVCDLFSKKFKDLLWSKKFDLIISNPPYVKDNELPTRSIQRQPEVLHEPKIALYGSKKNPTGLIYYERIISLSAEKKSDLLALEIDPPLIKDIKKLLKKNNLVKFEIIKDYSKLDRCLFVWT